MIISIPYPDEQLFASLKSNWSFEKGLYFKLFLASAEIDLRIGDIMKNKRRYFNLLSLNI